MKVSLLSETPTSLAKSVDAIVGVTLQLLACSQWQRVPLCDLLSHVVPPVRLNQYDIMLDDADRAMAFAAWAFFDDASFADHVNCVSPAPALADWNGGDRLFFTMFVAPRGCSLTFAMRLAKRLRRTHPHSTAEALQNRMIGVWRGRRPFSSPHLHR